MCELATLKGLFLILPKVDIIQYATFSGLVNQPFKVNFSH